MKRTSWIVSTVIALLAVGGAAQESKTTLDTVANAMGETGLKTIQYWGTGASFALGQSPTSTEPWPRFDVVSYTVGIDYDTAAMRQELIRKQGENPPRGGGGQPLAGQQRQIQVVSGRYAWNVAAMVLTPAPATADERALQIWLTPHGFVKAAQAHGATIRPQTKNGKKLTLVNFTVQGKWKVQGIVNDQNLVEKVETWVDNPVLGDMPMEVTYAEYKEFGPVKFPTRIVQKHGGFATLDVTIGEVRPGAPLLIEVPANVKETPQAPRIESQKIADGTWYVTGGSHHSAIVEFKDYLIVIEGPQNEDRSLAVIGEAKKLAPSKPIKYLVNTHQHFDHAGGIRTYAAEGATIVTHEIFQPYYQKLFSNPRTLNPDRLARTGKRATFETVTDRKILTDGARTLELHHVRGNAHNDGLLMAYLPREKLLIEADAYTPPAPDAPPPPSPNPFSVNLYENIQRLGLDVQQIAPLHGHLVTLEDLRKAIGKAKGTQD